MKGFEHTEADSPPMRIEDAKRWGGECQCHRQRWLCMLFAS